MRLMSGKCTICQAQVQFAAGMHRYDLGQAHIVSYVRERYSIVHCASGTICQVEGTIEIKVHFASGRGLSRDNSRYAQARFATGIA